MSSSGKLNDLLDRSRQRWGLTALAGLVILTPLVWVIRQALQSPTRLRARAEAAARDGDWITASRCWRAINATTAATHFSHFEEARACLTLGRAAQAEHSLHRAIDVDPSEPEAWRLLLEVLRIEDRTVEVQHLGWEAYQGVWPEARRKLLRELTLGLLADLPDDLVRTTLQRWIDADANDINARVALLQRIAAQPRADDPDRTARLTELETLLINHPEHIAAREALITALADAGKPEQGRALLNDWPQAARDARYWRLWGRWNLDYDHQPDRAALAFQTVLAELPQDWRSWYRLARALHIIGRIHESREAAETVNRLREVLNPSSLKPRLDSAFNQLDDSAALYELDNLCTQAGLFRLSHAWRTEAQAVQAAGSSRY